MDSGGSWLGRMGQRVIRRMRVGIGAFMVLLVFVLLTRPPLSSLGSLIVGLAVVAALVQVAFWLVERRARRRARQRTGGAPPAPNTLPARSSPGPGTPARSRPTAPAPARWVPAGETVTVHGLTIPGPGYVGASLPAPGGAGADPALIDPALPVDTLQPDASDASLSHWPRYGELSPASRAGYLAWLAGGRRDPAAPIGFVFLFYYGLERRVLVDVRQDEALAAELPAIETELRDLLAVYGPTSGSFRGYAGAFHDLIGAFRSRRQPVADLAPPPLERRGPEWPSSLRLGLARMAAERRPVPAVWALAWAWASPEIPLRTPATRCPELFARLFAVRYGEAHGAGMVVAEGTQPLALAYRPATAGIPEVRIPVAGLTDVAASPSPGRELGGLMDRVAGELDPYSRWLGRRPDGEDGLEAIALLPGELVDDSLPAAARLRAWAADRLGSEASFTATGGEVLAQWGAVPGERLNRAGAVRLAQAFARCGLGVEPDVRFDGPPIEAEGKVVVFPVAPGAEEAESPEYHAAMTLLHLAAAVGAADGTLAEDEIGHMARHIEASLHLSIGERRRLHAHLKWLGTTEIKLSGLRKRLDALTAAKRAEIGRTAIAIASVDGAAAPDEVRILTRIYNLLGLDASGVASDLHGALTTPSTDPVTMRPATPEEPGFPIPPRPAASAGLLLDDRRIQATLRGTAAVSALLGDIFAEEDVAPAATVPTSVPPLPHPNGLAQGGPVGGLDAPHSHLLRGLADRPRLTAAEYAELASAAGLMPGGAIDVINEAALDAIDDLVIDQDADGNLAVRVDLVKELLA